MKSFSKSVVCVFMSLMLSIGNVKAAELTCPLNIGRNQVLNLEQSEASLLGGYHKETMEDCIAGCCQQEWKLELDSDSRGHCNLVTFYQHEDESVMNCFMVQCVACSFSSQDDFNFAWVHRPKVDTAEEKDIATPTPPSNSKTEAAASEPQPSPSSTSKMSAKVSESVSSTTAKPVDIIIVDDTVTSIAEKESASPEANPVDTTPSTDDQKVSSAVDEKAHSTTDASPEEVKSSTTSKSSTQTESTTKANVQTESTTKPTTVSTTKALTTPPSKSTPRPESTPEANSTPKPESTSKTGSTTKSVVTTPKLEVSSPSETTPSQGSSTSTQASPTLSSSPDEISTPKSKTTPKQELVSQEKTTPAKEESTPKSQPEKVQSEMPSESVTETQTKSTVAFESEEMVTAAMASAGSKDAAVFTFETNNFVLILSLVLGVVLVLVVAVVLGRRWYEAYQRRHYNKVDYLINGS